MAIATPAFPLTEPKKQKPADERRPEPGDIIVHRFGERAGQPLAPGEVKLGGDLVNCITKDPQTGVVRDGSRLNGLIVVRFKPEELSAQTIVHAADGGVLAYSSVCNHQGCDLSQLLPDERVFKCYCHYSKFDPRAAGKPKDGPARRKLAVLPLKFDNGLFVAASEFVGRVGFKKRR